MTGCSPRLSGRTVLLSLGALGLIAAAVCCAGCSGSGDPRKDGGTGDFGVPRRPPNVLVVTMDTTRADHLACYGYPAIRTPNIDAVAAEGVLFEEAFTAQPVTLPSHSSIFTGKTPIRHGVRDNGIYTLAERNDTLAEVLARRGYLTTAFVSTYILDAKFGLDQGFRYYNDRFVKPKQKGRLPVDRRAQETSFLAGQWLDEAPENPQSTPFFLWLHYYDPHQDYDPPHPYKTAYANPYDGEIAYMDDWLGYFFDLLKARGLWDNTMVVLVADHGDGLGEHGEATHGLFIYRSTTHVPLIVKFPGGAHKGTRVPFRVRTVDIFPTVLEALGLPPARDIDGRSLLPLVRGEERADRDAYSETFIPRSFNWSDLEGLRSGDRFYIKAPTEELYDLAKDRDERVNTAGEDPAGAARARTGLDALLAAGAGAGSRAGAESLAVDEGMRDRLAALGYLAVDSVDPEANDAGVSLRPDPKDRTQHFSLQQRANSLAANGNTALAIGIMEQLVASDGGNPRFVMELAELYIDEGLYPKAESLLSGALESRPADTSMLMALARCYEEWGESAKAVAHYQRILAADPESFLARFRAGVVLLGMERLVEAEARFLEAEKLRPDDAATQNNLGYVAIKARGDFGAGIARIERAAAMEKNNPLFMSSLGWALHEKGDDAAALPHLEAALRAVPDDARFIDQLTAVYGALGETTKLEKLRARRALLAD